MIGKCDAERADGQYGAGYRYALVSKWGRGWQYMKCMLLWVVISIFHCRLQMLCGVADVSDVIIV